MFSRLYAKSYDLLNSGKPYKKEINFVYCWAEKPKSIFDIGCGTGSYWKHYPEGVHVFGIDKSPDMAEQGKRIFCGDVTNFKTSARFDCATALFHVINYIPDNGWWKNIPIEKGKYFIFDILDKKKVLCEGFKETVKTVNGITRVITPVFCDRNKVSLNVKVFEFDDLPYTEVHNMYIFSDAKIKKFCGKNFEIVDKIETKTWTTWFKCKRK